MQIRVNIDNTNCDDYYKIYEYLTDRYKKHDIYIYPGIIKDWSGKTNGFNCGFSKNEEVNFLIEQYNKYNIKPVNFFPDHTTPCTAQRIFEYVIGPEGELYKCWSDVGQKEYIVGSLFDEKSNSELLTKYLSCTEPFYMKKCEECFFIYVCGGGCPNQQLKNKFEEANFDTCTYLKKNLDKFLEIHFETKNKEEIKDLQF